MRRTLVACLLVALTVPAVAFPAEADGPAVERRNLRCTGDPLPGMDHAIGILENRLFNLTRVGSPDNLLCWGHHGTHTYYVGANGTYALRGGFGYFQPAETGSLGQVAVDRSVNAREPGAAVEVSLDGDSWTLVRHVPIPNLARRAADIAEGLAGVEAEPPVGVLYDNKPIVWFTLPDTGQEFRFLRIRQPKSFTEGLSAYVDGSELTLNVTRVATPSPLARAASAEYDCAAGNLQKVFADHPCRFGSTAMYFDSPSFTHTYWLGEVNRLTALSGTATFEPYRSLATAQQGEAIVTGVVEVSPDGNRDTWTEVATFRALYGTPAPFAVEGLDHDAQFVRVRTEKFVNFQQGGGRHWAGFVTQSTLALEGNVTAHERGAGDWSGFAWTAAEHALAPPWPACPGVSCNAWNGVFNG